MFYGDVTESALVLRGNGLPMNAGMNNRGVLGMIFCNVLFSLFSFFVKSLGLEFLAPLFNGAADALGCDS